MKKLALRLDELQVESFHTAPEAAPRGTVAAYDSDSTQDIHCMAGTHGGHTCDTTCYQIMCGCTAPGGTCDYSCWGTCFGEEYTCAMSCDPVRNCPTADGYQGC